MAPIRNRSGEYARRKERCLQLNICFRCRNSKGGNNWLCDGCLEKMSTKDKMVREHRKKSGFCKCGATPEINKECCSKCLEKGRKQQTRRRSNHKSEGACLTCGNQPELGKVICADCNKRATISTLNRYHTNIAAEKCAFCTGELDLSTFRCNMCHNSHLERSRAYWHQRRLTVIKHYGGRCCCCESTQSEFLDVDHIDGGGTKHRNSVDQHFYDWIIASNFPNNLQLLCANCNRGKSKFGSCPHSDKLPPCTSERRYRRRRQRIHIIHKYGNMCKCCGESNWAFLEFDHVNNDGNVHRKNLKSKNIIPWIIANNCPDTIQLLCSNCNKAKGLYGSCPHVAEKQSTTRLLTRNTHQYPPTQRLPEKQWQYRPASAK